MDRETLRVLTYPAFGFAVGCMSGALGIGGGVIFVPVMVLLLGFDIKRAVGTSLAALVPIALTGSATHFIINPSHIMFLNAFLTLAGAVAGVKAGVALHKRVHARALEILFALLLFFTGLKLSGALDAVLPSEQLAAANYYMPVLGVAAGICSSFFGIGGGLLFVPGFYFLFGMPLTEAIATSLFITVTTSLMGSMLHIREGNVDFGFVKKIAPFALIGAVFGAIISNILPARVIKMMLALFLAASAYKMLTKRGYDNATDTEQGGRSRP